MYNPFTSTTSLSVDGGGKEHVFKSNKNIVGLLSALIQFRFNHDAIFLLPCMQLTRESFFLSYSFAQKTKLCIDKHK